MPLPPPEPQNSAAWFPLPAATFLSAMPGVPDNLRLDNGFSVSREFLLSGLVKGKGAAGSGSTVAAQASSLSQVSEGRADLLSALEAGARAGITPPVVGPMGLRGVYVPLDNRQVTRARTRGPAAAWTIPFGWTNVCRVVSRITGVPCHQDPALRAYVPIPAERQVLLDKLLAQQEALAAGDAELLGALRSGTLPMEHTLPRRDAPRGW